MEGIRIAPGSEEVDMVRREDVVSGDRVGIRSCRGVLVGGSEGRGFERLGGYIN